jgi:hypothetical protein
MKNGDMLRAAGWTVRSINGKEWFVDPKTDCEVFFVEVVDSLTYEAFFVYISAAAFNAGARWQKTDTVARLRRAVDQVVEQMW